MGVHVGVHRKRSDVIHQIVSGRYYRRLWLRHEGTDIPNERYTKVSGCCRPSPGCPRKGLHVSVLALLCMDRHISDLCNALVGLRNVVVDRTVRKLEFGMGLHGNTGLLTVVRIEQCREVRLHHVGQGVHPDDEVLMELVRPENYECSRGDVVVHLLALIKDVVQSRLEEMSDEGVLEAGRKEEELHPLQPLMELVAETIYIIRYVYALHTSKSLLVVVVKYI